MPSSKEIRIYSLLVIDTAFFLLELIVGYTVHSLALVADSFHMLNDIISLLVALWAVNVSKTREADSRYTYGWQRAEILGALINAVFLLALCFTISIESIQRFISPEIITNPQLILAVGSAGLVSNLVGLVLFHEHGGHSHSHSGGNTEATGHSHSHGSHVDSEPHDDDSSADISSIWPAAVVSRLDTERTGLLDSVHDNHNHTINSSKAKNPDGKSLNMQGVFLHVLGDALGNVGVMLTALFIWKTDYSWRFYADPTVSLLITIIIFSSALPLCRTSSRILLQATPSNVVYDDVKTDILGVPGVCSVHDFHIWNLTEKLFIASLHVELSTSPEEFLQVAATIKTCLHAYGIHSVTIQPEFSLYYASKDNLPKSYLPSKSVSNSRLPDLGSADQTGYGSRDETSCMVDAAVGCNLDSCLKSL